MKDSRLIPILFITFFVTSFFLSSISASSVNSNLLLNKHDQIRSQPMNTILFKNRFILSQIKSLEVGKKGKNNKISSINDPLNGLDGDLDGDNIFLSFSKEAKNSSNFSHLNESINNPDLYFVSAWLEVQLKDFNKDFCNKVNSSNNRMLIHAKLVDHPGWDSRLKFKGKDKVDRNLVLSSSLIGSSGSDIICSNKSTSTCFNYTNMTNLQNKIIQPKDYQNGSLSSHSNLTQNIGTNLLLRHESRIELEYKCRVEKKKLVLLEIDMIPVISGWRKDLEECRNKERDHRPEGKDDGNLENFIFSLIIQGDKDKGNTLKKSNKDPSQQATTFNKELNLNVEYWIDERCKIPLEGGCKETDAFCLGESEMKDELKESSTCRLRSYCSSLECGVECNFEGPCAWKWRNPRRDETGFRNISAAQSIAKINRANGDFSGPMKDTNNKTDGNFLLLAWETGLKTQQQYRLTSPTFVDSQGSCNLQATIHMNNMENVELKMVIQSVNHSSYVPMSILGNRRNTWERLKQMIGKRDQPFQIILEIDNPAGFPSHFAIDNLRLVDCFPNKICIPPCIAKEFKCGGDGTCVDRNQICDLNKDCLNGEDENQNCEKLPANSTCTFEEGWCGWTPLNQFNITWERTNRPYYTDTSGPQFDHTFKNNSGHFLLVNMKVKSSTFHRAILRSPTFAHPPFYNHNRTSKYFESCQLRFFYHMYGGHVGTLDAEVVLKNPRNPRTNPIRFCERTGNLGNIWHRAVCKLPSIKGSKKYYIQITATRGIRGHMGDIAIDDISLSPECFGEGVPPTETIGYNYYEILNSSDDNPKNLTAYKLTTCNNTGRLGPTADQCRSAYNETLQSNLISMDSTREGVQIWNVPESKSYTLIAKGASGGRGALVNQMTSHGSIVRVTLYLRKGEQIFVLVGQEGISLCDQANVHSREKDLICKRNTLSPLSLLRNSSPLRKNARQVPSADSPTSKPRPLDDSIKTLVSFNRLNGGGGGGGGATFVYKIVDELLVPILVAAGGGGLGYNASANIYPNGRSLNVSLEPHSGSTQPWGAGGGCGWKGSIVKNNNSVSILPTRFQVTPEFQNSSTMLVSSGLSLIEGGGLGGEPCSSSSTWGASGGFGGGGGGCTSGGGGGGYVGGNAHVSLSSNGEGGWSFIGKGGMYPAVEPGSHIGPGEFVIIPSFEGCGCEHSCVLLDDFEPHSGCVCPENWILSENGINCVGRDFPGAYLIALIILCVITFCVVGIICFCLYNRYQRQKVSMLRRKVMGPELQLSRLRAQSGPGGVLTEYNPNYEFGGETYTLTDLKEIPRENLRLVKALGQGAFGEVYQGFYRHRDGDAVEMPVAVKTLPELSANQAEMDFLMEALIMSKFNHPNIVHFIGVCFDKHPRFIILELLAGGDLKTSLRESRPKPDKGSPLSMKDLLLCAMDVAKGCKYLEDNHFIHRDIAARNCLLTTKGPGRVVKIADFGMARDIYRADYYKKGGKAMLPVKWMPPEAFLDGIFTSKTDAWSYGVLLWEIFSLGYMPYPGRGNQDVMQLVTNGGRLDAPSNCPTPIYGIMSQCWHPIPEERPNFSTIMERLGYCIQDPEVVNAPLPIFQRPPSSERDVTLMRPPNSDNTSCLRIIQGHHHRSRNSSPLSQNEPLSPNNSTGDYLVPLTPLSNPTSPPLPSDFPQKKKYDVIPESESTETILEEEEPSVNGTSKSKSYPNATQLPSTSKRNNGIQSGITLKATSLNHKNDTDSSNSASSSKKSATAPYANVGGKKKRRSGSGSGSSSGSGNGNPSIAIDEEIRC